MVNNKYDLFNSCEDENDRKIFEKIFNIVEENKLNATFPHDSGTSIYYKNYLIFWIFPTTNKGWIEIRFDRCNINKSKKNIFGMLCLYTGLFQIMGSKNPPNLKLKNSGEVGGLYKTFNTNFNELEKNKNINIYGNEDISRFTKDFESDFNIFNRFDWLLKSIKTLFDNKKRGSKYCSTSD